MISWQHHSKVKALFLLGIWLLIIGVSGAVAQTPVPPKAVLVSSDHHDTFAVQTGSTFHDFSVPVETVICGTPLPATIIRSLLGLPEISAKPVFNSHPLQSKIYKTLFRVIISPNAP